MHLRLPSLEVDCSECRAPSPFRETHVSPAPTPFGNLGYYCKTCMLGG